MSIDDKAAFSRLEMQMSDLREDVSKIAGTVAVVPRLESDVDTLKQVVSVLATDNETFKRQQAQMFEMQSNRPADGVVTRAARSSSGPRPKRLGATRRARSPGGLAHVRARR